MGKLKEIWILIYIVMLLPVPTSLTKQAHIIVEGQSVDNIKLGMSIFQVDSILKSKPKRIVWGEYSYEYHYRNYGISIWEKQNDTTHSVFAISVNPNKWKGETKKGLKVNKKLKIKDIIEVYGKPEWEYTLDCSELSAEYPDLGLSFDVATINGICDVNSINHDSLFRDKNIIEICICDKWKNYN